MSVSKGYKRPEAWAPVGSIVQLTEDVRIAHDSAVLARAGDWVIFHLTNGSVRDSQDGSFWRVPLSLLHDGNRPRYKVFRRGRRDYSDAWHQTLPWMNDPK